MMKRACADRSRRTWWAAVILSSLMGCSDFETNVVPVSGVVTYGGQKVDEADVALLPRDSSSAARAARGVTDSEGKFTVNTYFNPKVDAAGARPGDYTVTVTKVAPPEGMTLEEWDLAQEGELAQGRSGTSVPPLRYLVPEKYSGARTSDLSVTVRKGQQNHFTLELHD